MDRLWIDHRHTETFETLGLHSCAEVLKFFGDAYTANGDAVVVTPKTLQLPNDTSLNVFFKLYRYQPPTWGFLGRRSKARCEYENYGVFEELGVATAERIACGEQRDSLSRLTRAFILTREIPGALPLPQFIEHRQPDRRVRDALLQQLADFTRCIHTAHFFHHDLVWRNVLVTDEPKLWFIDCPRGGFVSFGRRHRQIKDLASLDKVASQLATRRERLTFLKRYAGTTALAREVLAYRKKRWPADWHGQ